MKNRTLSFKWQFTIFKWTEIHFKDYRTGQKRCTMVRGLGTWRSVCQWVCWGFTPPHTYRTGCWIMQQSRNTNSACGVHARMHAHTHTPPHTHKYRGNISSLNQTDRQIHTHTYTHTHTHTNTKETSALSSQKIRKGTAWKAQKHSDNSYFTSAKHHEKTVAPSAKGKRGA